MWSPRTGLVRFAVPAQPVDATPSNALIRQYFPGRSDPLGRTRCNPTQVSVPADLTLASDLAFVFNASRVRLECCVVPLRPPREPESATHCWGVVILKAMIPASYNVRDLTIRPATVLAPMAGVTDTLFRRVIRGLGGCGLLMTEFTSSGGITRSAKKTLRYLYFQEDEYPITAPLLGASPEVMAEAGRMVQQTGCDAVMIGRAAATNPWIFQQMQQYAATGRYDTPTDADRHQLLSGYYREINAANQPDAVGKMKQFACWFSHGVGNGGELRRKVHAARPPGEWP